MDGHELIIEVVCRNLPGIAFVDPCDHEPKIKSPVHLGIQKGKEVIDAVPADSDREQVVFTATFKISRQPDGSPNFLGPFAKGTAQERFFYLSWGILRKDSRF